MDWFLAPINDPAKKPLGKLLSEQNTESGSTGSQVAEFRSTRRGWLPWNATIMIDQLGVRQALKEIAAVKLLVSEMLVNVLDRAMQACGPVRQSRYSVGGTVGRREDNEDCGRSG
jgi:acyl-CoA dehydrogenase